MLERSRDQQFLLVKSLNFRKHLLNVYSAMRKLTSLKLKHVPQGHRAMVPFRTGNFIFLGAHGLGPYPFIFLVTTLHQIPTIILKNGQ